MAKKNLSELATEVIDGEWGNGEERKQRLEAAGYNYKAVQHLVNKQLSIPMSILQLTQGWRQHNMEINKLILETKELHHALIETEMKEKYAISLQIIDRLENEKKRLASIINHIENAYRGSGEDIDEVLDRYFSNGKSPVWEEDRE